MEVKKVKEKVTQDQWEAWLNSPVTLALHNLASKARQGLMEQWAAGLFQGDHDELLIRNSAALGELTAWNRIRELELDQLNEVFEDD
jgi:hypothetical protein